MSIIHKFTAVVTSVSRLKKYANTGEAGPFDTYSDIEIPSSGLGLQTISILGTFPIGAEVDVTVEVKMGDAEIVNLLRQVKDLLDSPVIRKKLAEEGFRVDDQKITQTLYEWGLR